MAMVKTSLLLTSVEGKEGGTIWREDVCGQHMQAHPREVHRETPSQKLQRDAFRKAWYCLRRAAREGTVKWWVLYAADHPIKNKKGETVTLAWHQWFIKLNVIRLRNDLECDLMPPDE